VSCALYLQSRGPTRSAGTGDKFDKSELVSLPLHLAIRIPTLVSNTISKVYY